MKHPVLFLSLSLILFLSATCDNNTSPSTSETPAPQLICLHSCFVKDSYYEIQLNKLESAYNNDSTLNSPIVDSLLTIARDLADKCNCKTLYNCPACGGRGSQCCNEADCEEKECVTEKKHKPDCFTSPVAIDHLSFKTVEGKELGNADVQSGSEDPKGGWNYDIEYIDAPFPDIYILELKEKGNPINYIVMIKKI